jgi:biotin carboxyl carrier protein
MSVTLSLIKSTTPEIFLLVNIIYIYDILVARWHDFCLLESLEKRSYSTMKRIAQSLLLILLASLSNGHLFGSETNQETTNSASDTNASRTNNASISDSGIVPKPEPQEVRVVLQNTTQKFKLERWLVKIGEVVLKGQPVAVVAVGDKMFKYTAKTTGTIKSININAGSTASNGSLVLTIAQPPPLEAGKENPNTGASGIGTALPAPVAQIKAALKLLKREGKISDKTAVTNALAKVIAKNSVQYPIDDPEGSVVLDVYKRSGESVQKGDSIIRVERPDGKKCLFSAKIDGIVQDLKLRKLSPHESPPKTPAP